MEEPAITLVACSKPLLDPEKMTPPLTAGSLKKELRECLATLKTSFQNLDTFVAEITSEGTSAPISLTKSDLDDLISVSLELQDAANNLEFEARKIHDKLSSIIV